MKSALIIPALNEEAAIGKVLDELPAGLFECVIVTDNGSTDKTAAVAEAHGARVVHEPARGYGSACLKAIAALPTEIEIVVFMDADGSVDPREALGLIQAIEADAAEFVLGSRELGVSEPGAMSIHQRFGNRLATRLVKLFCGYSYTDLGPYRAIHTDSLRKLDMRDRNYGWTVEMQIKAVKQNLRILEIPVAYRCRRAGESKISGTVLGSVGAGLKILWTVARLSFSS